METTLRVLLLEKDPTEAELMEMHFRKASIKANVKRVPNLDLLLAEAGDAPPDLVLANHGLPRFDTSAVVEGLAKVRPGIPLILYALNGNEETAINCMKSGAADFILKKHMSRFGASVRGIMERVAAAAKAEAGAKEANGEKPVAEPRGEPPEAKEEGTEQRLFRQIVERAPDLIAVLRCDGRREYNNPAYTDVLEDPDILAGTDSFLDILPEDRERIRNVFNEIVTRGYGARTEYRLLDKEGETRHIQSNSGVILNEEGEPERIVVISRDVTEETRSRQRFEMLVASTAGLSGEGFFSVCAHRLADALGVRAALISRFAEGGRTRVRSTGFWADGVLQQEWVYDLAGMPCERVIVQGETVRIPSGASALYPRMRTLAGMRVESYLGVPLLASDGTPLGHLFLADDRPMADVERKEFIVRVMSRRASLELQRMIAAEGAVAPAPPPQVSPSEATGQEGEDAHRDQAAALLSAFEGLPSAVVWTDEAGIIRMTNPRLEALTGQKAADLIGRRAWPLLLNGGPWQLMKESYDDVVIRPDKSKAPVTVFAVPTLNREGKIAGTLGVLTPRTEQRSRRVD